MSFSQQSKEGFKLGLQQGMDMFFGMSGVIHRITQTFDLTSGGGSSGVMGRSRHYRAFRWLNI